MRSIVRNSVLTVEADPTLAAAKSVSPRHPSIDIARGVIMIVMALDHASVAWNAGRPHPCLEGLVGFPPIDYGTWAQQLTREITHICAPGFQFLAGTGLAISVFRRQSRGRSQWAISADMIFRGLVLCFCDFVLMYAAYGLSPFMFVVLACIGCSIIAFSLLRKLPLAIIALLSAVTILCAPFYAQRGPIAPSASGYAINVLLNIAVASAERQPCAVIYPILPWIGCFGLGWCLGWVYERGEAPHRLRLVLLGGGMIAAAFVLRWAGGGYGDRLPVGNGPGSAIFWVVSKYPPSPVFLLATVGAIAVMLGLLRPLDGGGPLPAAWRIPLVYGRVALFFYLVHAYTYGIYPVATGTMSRYGLETTYAVWLLGLIVLFFPCIVYHRMRLRHRSLLRYF